MPKKKEQERKIITFTISGCTWETADEVPGMVESLLTACGIEVVRKIPEKKKSRRARRESI